jgi:hypothetical protein
VCVCRLMCWLLCACADSNLKIADCRVLCDRPSFVTDRSESEFSGASFQWVRVFSGCQFSVGASFQWLPVFSGCQFSVVASFQWLPVFSGCQSSVGFQERLKGGRAVGHEARAVGDFRVRVGAPHKSQHAHKIENILDVWAANAKSLAFRQPRSKSFRWYFTFCPSCLYFNAPDQIPLILCRRVIQMQVGGQRVLLAH